MYLPLPHVHHHSNNQFTTEIALVRDLPMHPCHTEDPNEADAFIVPVQVGLE